MTTEQEERLNEEAARYCARVVPGWDQMPGYMQLHAVRHLVQYTVATLARKERAIDA